MGPVAAGSLFGRLLLARAAGCGRTAAARGGCAQSSGLHLLADACRRRRPPSGSCRPRSAAAMDGNAAADASADAESDDGVRELLLGSTRLTAVAHRVFRAVLRPGDHAIDATAGNGQDVLEMARLVGPSGSVLGIDVQERALKATRRTLEEGLGREEAARVRLLCSCHAEALQAAAHRSARLISFNLGYLPGGPDKSLCTRAATTLAAVSAATRVVAPGGAISILAYVGHAEGAEEAAQLRLALQDLSPREFVVSAHEVVNRPTAPRLLLLYRRPARA